MTSPPGHSAVRGVDGLAPPRSDGAARDGAAFGAGAGLGSALLIDLWCPVSYVPHLLMDTSSRSLSWRRWARRWAGGCWARRDADASGTARAPSCTSSGRRPRLSSDGPGERYRRERHHGGAVLARRHSRPPPWTTREARDHGGHAHRQVRDDVEDRQHAGALVRRRPAGRRCGSRPGSRRRSRRRRRRCRRRAGRPSACRDREQRDATPRPAAPSCRGIISARGGRARGQQHGDARRWPRARTARGRPARATREPTSRRSSVGPSEP